MENKVKYLMKNTGILAIGSFSSKFLIFLLVPLYTSVLTTSEYGTFDLISTTIQFLMPIITANIYEGVTRFLMDYSKPKDEVISIGIKFISIGIFVFGVLVFVNWKFYIWEPLAKYSLLTFAFFTVTLLNSFMVQFAKGMEAVKYVAIAGIMGTIVTVICNVYFLLGLSLGLKGFFLAYTWGQIVPVIYYFFVLKIHKYITFNIDKNLEKEMLLYSIPLVINTLGWWINNVSDRYVVTFICGVAANGIYSVSYKIPSILNVIQGIFTQSWQISAVKEYDNDKSKNFFGDTIQTINILVCSACMILILFSKILARILFIKDFYSAWKYVPFLLVSITINAASGVLGPILCAKKNSKAMATSAIYGAIVNIILNFILIYFIGIQGAAIATAISSLVIYCCRRKAVGRDITLTDKNRFIFSWIMIILQSIVMIYMEDYVIQLVLIGIFVIVFRKIFKNYLLTVNKIIFKRK